MPICPMALLRFSPSIAAHPDFADAVHRGRAVADGAGQGFQPPSHPHHAPPKQSAQVWYTVFHS
jgi:hypothetical protein